MPPGGKMITRTNSIGVPIKRATEGIVVAVVAVTGVVDEVDDLIMPGAFTDTLSKRRVKSVFAHSWLDPIASVLHIEEWKPGDRRLPKVTPMGKPWPVEAGVLVATMQYWLDVPRSMEVFGIVQEWAKRNEAYWSIGYRVPPALATKRRDGVRVIYGLDLFEVSPVLHGANSLTSALEVKTHESEMEKKETPADVTMVLSSFFPRSATDIVMEAKTLPVDLPGPKAAGVSVQAMDTGRVLMIQRAIDKDDPASGCWEMPGGCLEPHEHPLHAAMREWTEETGSKLPHDADVHAQWDSYDGIYRGYLMKVPTESSLNINVDHEDRNLQNPDDPDGDGIETVAWWNPEDLPNMPALRKEVAKNTPWELFGVKNPKPPVEVKAASIVDAARNQPVLESKMHPVPVGSYEARKCAVQCALTELLCKKNEDYVFIEGMYDDHVLFTLGCGDRNDSFSVTYTYTSEGVELGAPEPITLQVIAVPNTGIEEEASPSDAARVRYLKPAADQMENVTSMLMLSDGYGQKELVAAMRPALLNLLDALESKGMDVDSELYEEKGKSGHVIEPFAGEDEDNYEAQAGFEEYDEDPSDWDDEKSCDDEMEMKTYGSLEEMAEDDSDDEGEATEGLEKENSKPWEKKMEDDDGMEYMSLDMDEMKSELSAIFSG